MKRNSLAAEARANEKAFKRSRRSARPERVYARKKKPAAPPLDAEARSLLHSRARDVWQYIGYDCLQATAEAGEGDTVDRETVIELVCDADRLREELRRPQRGGVELDKPAAERAVAWLRSADYFDHVVPELRGAFPYARYGM